MKIAESFGDNVDLETEYTYGHITRHNIHYCNVCFMILMINKDEICIYEIRCIEPSCFLFYILCTFLTSIELNARMAHISDCR